MSAIPWRAWARVLHRDLGFFFFGATVVYALSGLAINHRHHWNPSYQVTRLTGREDPARFSGTPSVDAIKAWMKDAGLEASYQKHYAPAPGQLRVFFSGGTATVNQTTGEWVSETLTRRAFLHTFNKLHYNPGTWWLWFSDAFAVSLLIIAVTGLFLVRGRHGITRRGGLLVALGVVVPGGLVLTWL